MDSERKADLNPPVHPHETAHALVNLLPEQLLSAMMAEIHSVNLVSDDAEA